MTGPFDLGGRVAVVTGGYGVLGGSISDALSQAGARVAVLGRSDESAAGKVSDLGEAGGEAMALVADVLDEGQLHKARQLVVDAWGRVDILVNAAGGNVARARTDTTSVFDVPSDAFDEVVALNLQGTIRPSLVFAEAMAARKQGVIINISSMAAQQAMTGVPGYSVAKAGIDAFTRWMAMEMAQKHGDGIRVNAIAPGFFITSQNRGVLVNPDGTPTARAQKILANTPMGRFGRPEELNGAIQWLCSDASSFVTGAVIPIDGGFSIFSGV
ncbi:MAG: SDR family oxidoreductase [Gemmatimonadaceae bacterium]